MNQEETKKQETKAEPEEKELQIECKDCNGTGLFRGFSNHENTACVCKKCDGKGYRIFRYKPFTGRKKAEEGITRIFKDASWKNVYAGVHTFDDGTTIDFSKYGCTLGEWESGVEPIPLPF